MPVARYQEARQATIESYDAVSRRMGVGDTSEPSQGLAESRWPQWAGAERPPGPTFVQGQATPRPTICTASPCSRPVTTRGAPVVVVTPLVEDARRPRLGPRASLDLCARWRGLTALGGH